MPETPKAMLFDVGNVLLRLKTDDLLGRMLAAHPGLDSKAFLADIRSKESGHDAYERGQITGKEFYELISWRWKLKWTYAEWLKNWNNYFLPNRPMEVLIAKLLQAKLRLFGLSNTNREHYIHFMGAYRLFDGFEEVIGSHQHGLRKPEPEFYRLAIKKIGEPAGAILFIDDVAAHVEAARAEGMQGFHYSFNDLELKAFLKDLGMNLPVWKNRPSDLAC